MNVDRWDPQRRRWRSVEAHHGFWILLAWGALWLGNGLSQLQLRVLVNRLITATRRAGWWAVALAVSGAAGLARALEAQDHIPYPRLQEPPGSTALLVFLTVGAVVLAYTAERFLLGAQRSWTRLQDEAQARRVFASQADELGSLSQSTRGGADGVTRRRRQLRRAYDSADRQERVAARNFAIAQRRYAENAVRHEAWTHQYLGGIASTVHAAATARSVIPVFTAVAADAATTVTSTVTDAVRVTGEAMSQIPNVMNHTIIWIINKPANWVSNIRRRFVEFADAVTGQVTARMARAAKTISRWLGAVGRHLAFSLFTFRGLRRTVALGLGITGVMGLIGLLMMSAGCSGGCQNAVSFVPPSADIAILADKSSSMAEACHGASCYPRAFTEALEAGFVLTGVPIEGTSLTIYVVGEEGAEQIYESLPWACSADRQACQIAWMEAEREAVAAIDIGDLDGASNTFRAEWDVGRRLSERGATKRALVLISDARDHRVDWFFPREIPAEETIIRVLVDANVIPDLRGVDVRVCGVHPRRVGKYPWNPSNHEHLLGVLEAVLGTHGGARTLSITESCDREVLASRR